MAPSLAVLTRLAEALQVDPCYLLDGEEKAAPGRDGIKSVPVINERRQGSLPAPEISDGRVVAGGRHLFRIPGLRPSEVFAAYLPDVSMDPPFGKGELVVFSLTRDAADGDAALVDVDGEAVFRTVWELPDGQWRLQPSNARYEPRVIRGDTKVRMWPAIGRWQRLRRGRGGRTK